MLFRSNLNSQMRTWWQRVIRATVLLAVILGLAYASIPYWSAGIVRTLLRNQISEQTGLNVEISKVSLSWSEGVEITGLRIASPKEFGPGPMVEIDRISADFSPVNLFLHRRLAWVEVQDPEVFVQVDQAGNVNLAALKKLQSDTGTDRISVHRAALVISLPGQDKLLSVRVSNAQYSSGHLQSLGKITVAAILEQGGNSAPVSLRVAAGESSQATLAEALFNFSNVDLHQIPVTGIFGLPFSELNGRCRGSLNLQINRQGVVDQFGLNVVVHNLGIQPEAGPKLPVIPEAGLRISAVVDPFSEDLHAGLLDIQSASVRLPGIDLAGRASLTTEVLQGRWEAVKFLEAEGEVYPSRLYALLTGKRQMPHEVLVVGPARVKCSLNRTKSLFAGEVSIQANAAEVTCKDKMIKPAGRRLEVGVTGDLDRRNWRLRFDKDTTRLAFGANEFSLGGSISNLRQFIDSLVGDERQTGQAILNCLSMMDLQATGQIQDLASVAEPLNSLNLWPGGVNFDGTMTASCSVRRFPDTWATVSLKLPAETELSIGSAFSKNVSGNQDGFARQRPMNLDISGKIHPQESQVRMMDVDLVLGPGRISLNNGTVRLGQTGRTESWLAEGRCDASGVEHLRMSLPTVGELSSLEATGRFHGRYLVRFANGLRRALLEADLKDLAVGFGQVARKPIGQESNVSLDFAAGSSAGTAPDDMVMVKCLFPQASISLAANFRKESRRGPPVDLSLKAKISDSVWLADTLPVLAKHISPGALTGQLEVESSGTWQEGRWEGSVNVDGNSLAMHQGGQALRSKAAGVPLSVAARGSVVDRGGRFWAEIDKLQVRLGGGQLAGTCGAEFIWPIRFGQESSGFIPSWLSKAQARLMLESEIDEALTKLLPELSGPVRTNGLSGRFAATMDIGFDGQRFAIASQLDASQLGVGQIGLFTKPIGRQMEASIKAIAPADLSHLQIKDLSIVTTGLEVLADANCDLLPDKDGGLILGNAEAQVSMQVGDSKFLVELVPNAGQLAIRGGASLECRISRDQAGTVCLDSGQLQATRLSGRWRGKDASLAGALAVGEVLCNAGRWQIGWLKTDGLELQAGRNHCWVDADLTGLPATAEGRFHVLAEYLDDKDLIDFIFGDVESMEASASAETKPAASKEFPSSLSVEQKQQMRAQADRMVGLLRTYSLPARIDGRFSIEKLKTFDASVGHSYDLDQIEAQISIDTGRISASYAAAMNGGTIRGAYDTHLSDVVPVVVYKTSMEDVIATESFQPQLAKYFPGNTFRGLFSRTEQSTVALRNMLANAADWRYPLNQTGVAQSTTTDGMIQGRSAPRFVTRIFPGLNLTKYPYNKMTAFAKFLGNGMAENDMVFSGETYDIYIEGTTDAENIGRYQIGLILLGSPQQPEWNHTYKQGRIPILKLKARIEGGHMYDEVVTYPWPNESAFVILVQNNIFYRIWLTAKGK